MGQSETPWGSGGWMEGNMCGAHMYMSVFVCDGGVGGEWGAEKRSRGGCRLSTQAKKSKLMNPLT